MVWTRRKADAQDLRDRALVVLDNAGEPVARIADMLLVSVSYVSRVLSRRRLTGESAARPQRCHVSFKLLGLQQSDPRVGGTPSRCDNRGSAALVAGDARRIRQHDPGAEDLGADGSRGQGAIALPLTSEAQHVTHM
jgi:hypothetical protein